MYDNNNNNNNNNNNRAVWLDPTSVSVGLGCGLDCTPALSVTYSAAAAAVCGLWYYISAMPLPFFIC